MNYSDPPGGKVGEVASRVVANPKLQLEQDLRNLKAILEGQASPEDVQRQPAATTVRVAQWRSLPQGLDSCSWEQACCLCSCFAGGAEARFEGREVRAASSLSSNRTARRTSLFTGVVLAEGERSWQAFLGIQRLAMLLAHIVL
jgi:hypothetical protein